MFGGLGYSFEMTHLYDREAKIQAEHDAEQAGEQASADQAVAPRFTSEQGDAWDIDPMVMLVGAAVIGYFMWNMTKRGSRRRKNPGTRWHVGHARAASHYKRKAKTKGAKSFFGGKRRAHM